MTSVSPDGPAPSPPAPLPPLPAAPGLVGRFDRWVDEGFQRHLRGNAIADRVFYGASAVGDHGVIWLMLAAVQGLRGREPGLSALRTGAAIGLESVVVNGPVKWVFRRPRPDAPAQSPHPLRIPRSSSFPSGHATSAFCAAALLSESDPSLRPLYYALAMVVAWSRVHVRVHHASDVVGGAIIGAALGAIFKRLLPLLPPDR